MPAEKFDFPNAQGQTLAALLDRPDGPVRAVALFAHCFTCGKNNRAARRIAEGLKLHGIAVLRFDFTGLGASEGEFANTTFSSNVDDLVAAADHLRRTLAAPAILIGHSLGGAAVLAAAHRVPEAKAVVTIAAPFDPAHVVGLFGEKVADIGRQGRSRGDAGRAAVQSPPQLPRRHQPAKSRRAYRPSAQGAAGLSFADRRYRRHRQCQPHFLAAKHPKSFISLAGADHLISRAGRRGLCCARHRGVGRPLSRHGGRCCEWRRTRRPAPCWCAKRGAANFSRRSFVGDHRLLADEPVKDGGLDSGPGPYDLLLAALGACTSMTLRLYADLKQIPLARTQVRLRHEKIYATDCAECETKEGKIDHIDRAIAFEGDLTAEQRARLLEIADKCPVHRTLKSEVDIRTVEAAADQAADRT